MMTDELKRLLVIQMKEEGYLVLIGDRVSRVMLPEQVHIFDFKQDDKELKEELIGKYYLAWPSEANRYLRIIDCDLICRTGYTYDGLALLLDDNFWRFGCPREFIRCSDGGQ